MLDLDALRGRIVAALGLGTVVLPGEAGCGSRRIEVDGSGSSETGTGGSSTSTGGDSSGETSGEGTSGPALDIAPDNSGSSTTSNPACDGLEPEVVEGPVPLECQSDDDVALYVCFVLADPEPCDSVPVDEECILDAYGCGFATHGNAITCGPIEMEFGQCCYVVTGDCPIGRPMQVRGRARLAELALTSEWARVDGPVPALRGLDPSTRAALADVWGREGAFEHASVASFSRFTLQMLSLGAPPDLIAAIQRATLEEVEHARARFALASAFAGRPVGPGALDVRGALDEEQLDPLHIAVTLTAEACVAETVSSAIVSVAAGRATDPVVRSVLAEIAREEQSHVELGWRCLAWMLPRCDPATRRAIAGTFARANSHVGLGAVTQRVADAERLADFGHLDIEQRRRIAVATLESVVQPIAARLVSGAFPAVDPRPLMLHTPALA